MSRSLRAVSLLTITLFGVLCAAPPAATADNKQAGRVDRPDGELPTEGQFVRSYWYEKGIEHGNPPVTGRFRVNAPEAVIGNFKNRSEVRGNGMMQILITEDLAQLAGAELYLEIWGGHPGTANKRVTPNGRTTYMLPKVGTDQGHCTHMYPTVPLKVTDLVNGYNALQFACDQGNTFWGHFIVDGACLRTILKADHPDPKKMKLAGFTATVKARAWAAAGETIELSLDASAEHLALVESVEYHGHYRGYDENGNRLGTDWHGFTKRRQPVAIIGKSAAAPFVIQWDVAMLPDQKDMAVRAVVHFKGQSDLTYRTAATLGLATPQRKGARVTLNYSKDLPAPFWSRVSRRKKCTIVLDADPKLIEQAQLHVVIWDGGAGDAKTPFALNGHALSVAGKGRHDVVYRVLKVDPAILKKGQNEIALVSSTKHHGIEVLLPGPALMVRTKPIAN